MRRCKDKRINEEKEKSDITEDQNLSVAIV